MLTYLGYGRRWYGDHPLVPVARRGWEFQAVVAGVGELWLPDGVRGGDGRPRLWVCPPEHVHGWRGRPGRSCEVVVLHFDHAHPIMDEEARRAGCVTQELSRDDVRRLRRMALDLAPDYRRPTALTALRADAAMLALCEVALRPLAQRPPASTQDAAARRVERAVAWYQQHMQEDPSVEDVAAAVAVSPAHLRRLFAAQRGRAPLEVMRSLQLTRAKQLMQAGGRSLKEVAAACGFSGPTVFSRAFRTAERVSPSAWWASHRAGREVRGHATLCTARRAGA